MLIMLIVDVGHYMHQNMKEQAETAAQGESLSSRYYRRSLRSGTIITS